MGDVEEMLDELEDGKPKRDRHEKRPAKKRSDDGFDLDVETVWGSGDR